MSIELVSLTLPSNGLTAEQFIAHTARVSNPDNQNNTETMPKLIKYLVKNSHVSPFEMVDMCVKIVTSRAIGEQILRHWSFSFQVFSQRYAEVGSAGHIEYPARRQDTKNRQSSIDDMAEADRQFFKDAQLKVWETSHGLYKEALDRGIAKEQARFLLPLNTTTTMYMKGSVRDWMFYLDLRCGNGTQKEHADIALAIRDGLFRQHFPNVYEAMGWNEDTSIQ